MLIKNNIYNFKFKPIKYEFNTFNKYSDIYDLNWLVIEFSFEINEKQYTFQDAIFTAFEIHNFILQLEKENQGELLNLEPGFSLKVEKNESNILVSINYQYLDGEVFNLISFTSTYSEEELKDFIQELKKEYALFPYRRVLAIASKKTKFLTLDDLALEIKKHKEITGIITNDYTKIYIKSDKYDIIINDVYGEVNNKLLYEVVINNKPYCYVEEESLIEKISELYSKNLILIEHNKEVGLFKKRWFTLKKVK